MRFYLDGDCAEVVVMQVRGREGFDLLLRKMDELGLDYVIEDVPVHIYEHAQRIASSMTRPPLNVASGIDRGDSTTTTSNGSSSSSSTSSSSSYSSATTNSNITTSTNTDNNQNCNLLDKQDTYTDIYYTIPLPSSNADPMTVAWPHSRNNLIVTKREDFLILKVRSRKQQPPRL
jgi:activator of HSP90 ATPase